MRQLRSVTGLAQSFLVVFAGATGASSTLHLELALLCLIAFSYHYSR